MTVSLDDIKKLREATGVSMMSCKKALEESNGDFEKSIEILRKKGEAKALDRVGRSTSNGAVVVKSENNKSALVQLECETDFVARGEEFLALAEKIADRLLKGEIKSEDRDLPEIKDYAIKLGENVRIADMKLVEGENVGDYIHSNRKIGVLVSLKGGNKDLARDIAMHVAATNPRVTSPEEISQELVDKEKEIWSEQLKAEGKPAEMIDKIMMGKERKFREENALIKQVFVKDNEKTIEELLKQAQAQLTQFVRFAI